MPMMEKPVENGGRDTRIATDLRPLAKALIGGHDAGPTLVPAGDALEEQVGPMPVNRDISHLIDDEELGHGLECQALLEAVFGRGLRHRSDEGQRRGEERPMALLDGLQAQPKRQMGLPSPGRSQQHDVLPVLNEPTRG